jgi:hypothetical protein
MSETTTCPECGAVLGATDSICRECGWDSTTAVIRPPRRSILGVLRGGAWRLIVYGAIFSLPLVGFSRLRATGPGPDLATTLRWMAVGDDQRAAELVTIHRAHQIATAAARYAVRELQPPPLDGDWGELLSPYSTMMVRGWMPLLFYGATTDMAPASVREFFSVRTDDGWGRAYRITARPLPRSQNPELDEQALTDLEAGLQRSFYDQQGPELDNGSDWLRLEIVSGGRDGLLDSADDLRVISYMQTGFTIHLSRQPEALQRMLDEAYTIGRHFWRLEGSRWDLIDSRLLAEFRLEYLP